MSRDKDTETLIDKLADDAKHSGATLRPMSPAPGAVVWTALAACYTWLTALVIGPAREGVLEQLMVPDLFAAEVLLGVTSVLAMASYALLSSVPGRASTTLLGVAVMALFAWIALLASGLWSPYVEPSMLGKREHCFWESYLYSVPAWLGLTLMLRRRYMLSPRVTLSAAAVAAGLVPAVTMQLVCMHDPLHGLLFHVSPALPLVVLALGAGWRLQRGHRSLGHSV